MITPTPQDFGSVNPYIDILKEIDNQIAIKKARQSYYDYVQFANPDYKPSRFHEYLCNKLEDFITQDSSPAFDVLLLSVPPQHGKSLTITETLPSWFLMKNPKKRIIIASYNEDFAIRFGRRNKEKIEALASILYPQCKLAVNPRSNVEFETTEKGRCISRGITSGITGNPADLIIIDDPIKNRQEADSETTRKTVFEEYLNSIRTRLAPHAKLIVIQTRWHEEDLFGMIAKTETNPTIINIPCECVDPVTDPLHRNLGDALCPEIGRDNLWLQDFKKAYMSTDGARAWTALYQGAPNIQEGNLIKRDWWRFFKTVPHDIPYKILSVDCAFKEGDTNDFVAIELWGKKDDDYFLLDLVDEHLSFVDTLEAIRTFHREHDDILFTLIEDKANGSAVINVLSDEIEGIVPILPEGGKFSRASAVTPKIETGHVWLPLFAGWKQKFIDECATFPNGAHDDQVDAMTQALHRMIFVDAKIVSPKYIKYSAWTDDMWQDYELASENLKTQLLELWGHPEEWKDEEIT